MITKDKIMDVLYDEYVKFYDEKPEKFLSDTRIFADLHAEDSVGKAYALEWLHNVARRIGLKENRIQHLEDRDYELKEVVNILEEKLLNTAYNPQGSC